MKMKNVFRQGGITLPLLVVPGASVEISSCEAWQLAWPPVKQAVQLVGFQVRFAILPIVYNFNALCRPMSSASMKDASSV